jgi:hypothetical protein
VDAFVLDLLEERVLTSRDFAELPNGICRVRAPLTHALALTLPRWRQLMAPIVAHLAQRFRGAHNRAVSTAAIPRTFASQAHALAPSPLQSTPRKQPVARPYASKAWSAPRPEPLLLTPATCAACGKPVVKRRRRHCDECIPAMRATHANKVVVAARKVLAIRAAAGDDPRNTREANRKRGHANAQHHRRNHEWAREHLADGRDRAWFQREVRPRLAAYPLNAIARATGLSLAACSRIRAGSQIPHPRHWDCLAAMLGGGGRR